MSEKQNLTELKKLGDKNMLHYKQEGMVKKYHPFLGIH